MTIKQLPDFAFRSATDYATAMDQLHARYDPVLGAARRRRHGAAVAVRGLPLAVVQRRRWSSSSSRSSSARSTGRPGCGAASATSGSPSPSRTSTRCLPDRAAMDGVAADDVRAVLRRNGFHVREATEADGTRFLYGDRHQYTKMATLLHARRADPLPDRRRRDRAARRRAGPGRRRGRVADRPADRHARACCWSRTSTSRRPASTPASRPTSRPTWRSTRTASEIARKTIRVNDPLSIAGYTFHQNGFGPAPARRPAQRGRGDPVGRAGPDDRRRGRAGRTRRSASPAGTWA